MTTHYPRVSFFTRRLSDHHTYSNNLFLLFNVPFSFSNDFWATTSHCQFSSQHHNSDNLSSREPHHSTLWRLIFTSQTTSLVGMSNTFSGLDFQRLHRLPYATLHLEFQHHQTYFGWKPFFFWRVWFYFLLFHSSWILLVLVLILASGLPPPSTCYSFSSKEFMLPILLSSLFSMFSGHCL